MLQDPTFSEKTLELIKQRFSFRLPPDYVHSLRMQVYDDRMSDFELHIERKMYGERITTEQPVTYKVPATWWDHFKATHFYKWLQRKFPVKYSHKTITVKFERCFEFPNAYDPHHPQLGRYVIHDMNPIITYPKN